MQGKWAILAEKKYKTIVKKTNKKTHSSPLRIWRHHRFTTRSLTCKNGILGDFEVILGVLGVFWGYFWCF
jgi:hypothetical protein